MTGGPSYHAQQLLERGTRELEDAGIPQSQFQAELILLHAMGWSREVLLSHLQEPVPAETAGHFYQLVAKRRERIPLQYLVGTQEFWGLEMKVTPAVLIPRPETEGIVEATISVLKKHPSPRIADVGCGSGCIVIALATELPQAFFYATDVSAAALAIARENAHRHSVAERIEFLNGDLLTPLANNCKLLDVVVANPPYISEEDYDTLQPEVRDHEPPEALRGGKDGLAIVTQLLIQTRNALVPGGRLFLEIGMGQESKVRRLVRDTGLEWLRTLPDLQGHPRVLIAIKPLQS